MKDGLLKVVKYNVRLVFECVLLLLLDDIKLISRK